MTAKEKAKELYDKMYLVPELNGSCILTKHTAKQCALIAVDEIIKEYSTLPHFGELYLENIEYYQEVKQEIELL
jgi:hypothetical protein